MVSSGITSNFFSNFPVDNQTFASNKNTDADFGAIMTQSMLSGNNELQDSMKSIGANSITNTSVQPVDNKNVKPENKAQSKDDVRSSDEVAKEDDISNKDVKNETKVTKSDKESSDKEIDGETKEQTVDALKKIKDKIVTEFEVSEEEIENALMTLGFTMADLLDESNMTDFVVELTGMESSLEIITDADMNAVLTDLTQFVAKTAEELQNVLEVSDEELEQIISEVSFEDIKEDATVITENVADKKMQVITNDSEVTKEQVKEETVEISNENKDTIQINVSKEAEVTTSDDKESKNSFSGRDNKDTGVKSSFNEAVGTIVSNLNEAVNEVFETSGVNEIVDAASIIDQIIETAKVTLNQETTTMEMILNPENLGKVNLNVSVKEGVVTATITAQDEMVKSAIENQLAILKENLNNQGLKIQAVEVTVESHAFEAGTEFNQNSGYENNEQSEKKGQRPLRLDSLDDLVLDQLTDDEKIVLDMMQKEGNQVNFTA